ncbi:MAG: acyl-ACP--UDP-N-acetylglucosamine O-acyltransferase [Gammaproteobacteria bacterium]|nr:MAG: acyl-ACP--UDP-N-acetylglucosamine O-acyltransferase [Gammaproteobacteria bacterium]
MIDARAVIAPDARIGDGVMVGPYSVIGSGVEIGAGTWIGPHVVINGPTRIGRDNKIYQFASLGDAPQDKKYAGENTRLEIGDRNVIREYCTINRGTAQDKGVTRIGHDNWIMAYAHIAHDCVIGDQTIFANAASLAGHVTVGDYAILGGFTLVHQFCAIGAHCFCGMGSVISMDVPPYVMVSGHPARPHGINSEGLKRRGFSAEALRALREAYKLIYKSSLTLSEAREQIAAKAAEHPELELLARFLEQSQRGIVR